MTNRFDGVGNLGQAPRLTQVTQQDDTIPVLDLRIYFERPVPGAGNGEYVDRGGFWLNVSLWGARAEQAAPLLNKGTRVCVRGVLVEDRWTDAESGERRIALKLRADYLALDPLRLVSIVEQEARHAPAA
jgi:single-strand DNA-binding protein